MTARTEAVAWMLRFLQDGYRLTGDVDWSRNHPAIDVLRDGRRYHFTVNPKDTRFNLKRQDIVRRLGPPPYLGQPLVKTPKSSEKDMAISPGPAPAPFNPITVRPTAVAPTNTVFMACYGNGKHRSLRLMISEDVAARHFPSGLVLFREYPDCWGYMESTALGRKLHLSHNRKNHFEQSATTEFQVFPIQPVSFTVVDGGIEIAKTAVVRKPLDPLWQSRGAQAAIAKAAKRSIVVTSTPTALPAAPTQIKLPFGDLPSAKPKTTEERLRALLIAIAEEEARTAYRLVRLKTDAGEVLEWRAPSIRL